MKKYVLTDPCYLINDDAAWRRYCGLIFDEKGYMNVDNGAAFIAEQLGTTVQVASTGYGDWANSLACVKGPNRLKNDGCFCADAGMVCFCWTRVKITDGASVYMSEECDYEDEDDY